MKPVIHPRSTYEQEILDAKADLTAEFPGLAKLNSPSKVAVWRSLVVLVAFIRWLHQQTWGAFWDAMEQLLRRNVMGTLPWYVAQSKLFQWSDSRSYYLKLNEFYGAEYAEVVEADRIIQFVAAIEVPDSQAGTRVVLKVARDDGTGKPAQLPQAALQSYQYDFIPTIKPAGVKTDVLSLPADVLKPSIEISYDPSSNEDDLRQRLTDALDTFLYAGGLPFNGELYLEQVRDALQRVEGVIDVHIPSLVIEQLALNPVELALARSYVLEAGYGHWHDDLYDAASGALTLIPKLP